MAGQESYLYGWSRVLSIQIGLVKSLIHVWLATRVRLHGWSRVRGGRICGAHLQGSSVVRICGAHLQGGYKFVHAGCATTTAVR